MHASSLGRAGRRWLAAAVVLWALVVTAGMGALFAYKATPGPLAAAPAMWPADTVVPRTAGLPTLIMLAHPRCPCTRASLAELAQVMSVVRGHVTASVLFLRPEGASSAWEKTDLWGQANAIDGVTVMWDEDGREAARFDASVSGQALAYDAEGRLVFRGGITGARGHAGDNLGRRRLLAVLSGSEADLPLSSVFGCSLLDPEQVRWR